VQLDHALVVAVLRLGDGAAELALGRGKQRRRRRRMSGCNRGQERKVDAGGKEGWRGENVLM
jgi:hypothetical protein